MQSVRPATISLKTDVGLGAPGKEWYAVYTVVRHEKRVLSALSDSGVQAYLPLTRELSRWKDRKKVIERPLFPGYLFACMGLEDRWDVLSIRGVVSIVGANGCPIPVPHEEIEAIRRLIESGYRFDPFPYLKEGREVIVINGPLQGVRGKILRRLGDTRLVLSIDIIRRSVAVEIDIRDVDPV